MSLRSLISLGIAGVLTPGTALACACCADPGQRFDYAIEFTPYEREQIAEMQTQGPAKVFMTACGPDCVEGIADPQDAYQVEMAVYETGIDFDLSDATGTYRGTLAIDFPAEYTLFGVDTRPNEGRRTTVLFHEMRMRGVLRGLGDFHDVTGAQGELILSGFGNACLMVAELQNWSITGRGAGVDFQLFGAFAE